MSGTGLRASTRTIRAGGDYRGVLRDAEDDITWECSDQHPVRNQGEEFALRCAQCALAASDSGEDE